MEKPDGLNLNDEQVKAMMEWQLHAAYWIASQAVIITKVSGDEGLDLGNDDVLRAAVELFKLARDEDLRNSEIHEKQQAFQNMIDPATGAPKS